MTISPTTRVSPDKSTNSNALSNSLRPLLIDSTQASDLLSIGKRTLWSYMKRDAIPCHRIGSAVRYCPEELDAWIKCGCPDKPGAAKRVRAFIGLEATS